MNRMKRQIINTITDALSVLIGQPLVSLTRGEGVLHVGIVTLKFGSIGTIDAMCGVRFIADNKIVFTNEDIFHPNSEIETILTKDGVFDWDAFDYNPSGNSFFDEMAANHFDKEMDCNTVENIKVSRFGDLTITLESGFTLEFFADGSGHSENWRFNDVNSSKPLIVTSKGIIDESF